MTENTAQLIPFGKYKGQPIEVLRNDAEYVDWLMGQSWFSQRFPTIQQIVINNFSAPTETPVHNAIQGRFLDWGFCCKLISVLASRGALYTRGFSGDRHEAVTLLSASKNMLIFEPRGFDVMIDCDVTYSAEISSAPRIIQEANNIATRRDKETLADHINEEDEELRAKLISATGRINSPLQRAVRCATHRNL